MTYDERQAVIFLLEEVTGSPTAPPWVRKEANDHLRRMLAAQPPRPA